MSSMSPETLVFHLELTSPEGFKRGGPAPEGLTIEKVQKPKPELNRYFYREVGRAWSWTDRLGWDLASWKSWLAQPGVETWLARFGGEKAGYAELELQAGPEVEIVYFGFLPAFCGLGLGAAFISRLVERGWELQGRRVWLHTCTLDDPRALSFYQARGFRVFRTERMAPGGGPGCRRERS